MVVSTLEIFYVALHSKNFGVGIEPTRTSIAGGAPFAFPLLDLVVHICISLSEDNGEITFNVTSMEYNTAFYMKKILLFCRIQKKIFVS